MTHYDLRDATINSLRRRLAIAESEIENRNERIQNLLREIDSLNATLRDAPEYVKPFLKDSKHD